MFFHFWRKFKNSKWPPFLGRGNFFENCQYYIPLIPCGSKISTKSLYLARLRRYKQFCVFPFLAKIQNGRHFWGGENFLKINNIHSSHTLRVENFDEIALSRTVKEIQAILCFSIFGENSKIQNGRHFWGGEFFLKIANTTFLLYPVGRKFRRNRSISHG